MMFQRSPDAPPRRQLLLLGGLAALVCALLLAAWLLFLRPQYGVLFSQLRTADAATIVAELDKKKIAYRLEQGGTTILVPADRVDGTRLAIMSEDLPLKGQVGFELFNKSDMGLTDFAQKINYQRALQGELARTIMTVDAVDSARVHLSLSEHGIFRDDRVAAKASVTLVPRPGHRITVPTVVGIQRLVAAAVPELEASNVVVIDEDGRVIGSELGANEPAESPERQRLEKRYERDVRRAIAGIAPVDATVSVWAGEPRRSPDASGGGDAAWEQTDSRRDFPLHVTISVATPVSPAVEEALKGSALAALGPEARGDAVLVTTAPTAPTEDPAAVPAIVSPSAVAPSASLPVRPEERDLGGIALWAGFAVILLGLVALALRRRGGPRPLSEKQRARFVSQFQSLLEREEANV